MNIDTRVVSDEEPRGIIRDLSLEPLTCRVYRDPQGQPLKTALANNFPLLSRRQRRELMRSAIKAQTRAQKAGK
jgi:hypothetical protein